MTTRASVVMLMLTASAPAADLQMVPLADYVGQIGIENDPAALAYIAERCGALYGVFGKNLENETDPARQSGMAEAYAAAEKFIGLAAEQMMRGTTMEMKDAFARTSNTTVQLGNLYVDRIEAVRLRTNNMFSDSLITGDFATCKGLIQKLSEK